MIDPQLFPLFETLSRANLDWLVQEILEFIALGEIPLESGDELAAARQRIANGQDVSAADLPDIQTVGETRRYPSEEQIRIAGSLVVNRITENLVMIKYSIDRLDQLIESAADGATIQTRGSTLEVVDEREDQPRRAVDRDTIRRSFDALSSLRLAIEQWQADVTQGAAP